MNLESALASRWPSLALCRRQTAADEMVPEPALPANGGTSGWVVRESVISLAAARARRTNFEMSGHTHSTRPLRLVESA